MDSLDGNTLIGRAMSDMKNNPNLDSWNSRVEKIKYQLDLNKSYGKPVTVGNNIDRAIKSKFDRFFLIR